MSISGEVRYLVALGLALAAVQVPRIDVALAGTLAYVALCALRPGFCPAAVIASLPFYQLGGQEGGFPLPPLETALVFGAAGVALRWSFDLVRGAPGVVRLTPTPFDWPIVMFLLAGLLSLLPSQFLHLSLRELRTVVVEPILFFYVLASVAPAEGSHRTVERAVGVLIATACVIALAGLVQVASGVNVVEAEGSRRALGTYGSPNHLGLLLGRAAPFGAAAVLWLAGPPRWASLAILVILLVGLATTLSVGAWLGLVVALLAVGGLRGRRTLAASAVALVALGALGMVVLPSERLASHLDLAGGTSAFRLNLWLSSLEMLKDHPLLGVGLDNFLYLYQQSYLREAAAAEGNLSHPHNVLLHFWLQMGLLGLATALWLSVRFFRAALRAYREAESPTARWLAAGALGSMVDFAVHGLVDNSYFLPDMAVLFWLSLAVAQLLGPEAQTQRGP